MRRVHAAPTEGRARSAEFWVFGGVLALTIVVLGFATTDAPEQVDDATGEAAASAAVSGGREAFARGRSRRDDGEDADALRPTRRREDVEADVAARNGDAGLDAAERDAERLRIAGWREVRDVARVDARLVAFEPALIDEGREEALRLQLASTSAGPGDVANLVETIQRATRAETRVAAALALGYVKGRSAQTALINLIVDGALDRSDPARRTIVSLLRPESLHDDDAAKLARLLDSSAVSRHEREQIAFNLAVIGLRDGTTLAAPLVAALSNESRQLLDDTAALARRGVAHRQSDSEKRHEAKGD